MKEYAANDGPEAGTELATAALVLLVSPSVVVLIEHAPRVSLGCSWACPSASRGCRGLLLAVLGPPFPPLGIPLENAGTGTERHEEHKGEPCSSYHHLLGGCQVAVAGCAR